MAGKRATDELHAFLQSLQCAAGRQDVQARKSTDRGLVGYLCSGSNFWKQ